MSFASLPFIFLFLPVSVIVYQFIKKHEYRNICLLVLSWLFYAWASLEGITLLLVITFWCWFAAGQLEAGIKKKGTFITAVAGIVVILAAYKYLPLGLPMPMGLSFYSFSAISYLADIYMGKAGRSGFVDTALYLAFFGKLIQGPIMEYHDMAPQLENHKVTSTDRADGALRFMKGLAKKVLIADQLALIPGLLEGDASMLGSWLVAIGYSFQLYYDFSGYSDMAIGVGRFFGFHLPENFDHPYHADSVREFWHRWHISLTRWFRDYVYIPLGGSRVDEKTTIRNIVIVWLLTGIWHGASFTFIVWGAYYAALLIIERKWLRPVEEKMPHAVRVLLMFLAATIGWVFFQSENLAAAFSLLGHMFASTPATSASLFVLKDMAVILILAVLFCGMLGRRLQNLVLNRFHEKGTIALAAIWMVLFVFCIALIVSGSMRTFMYAAF